MNDGPCHEPGELRSARSWSSVWLAAFLVAAQGTLETARAQHNSASINILARARVSLTPDEARFSLDVPGQAGTAAMVPSRTETATFSQGAGSATAFGSASVFGGRVHASAGGTATVDPAPGPVTDYLGQALATWKDRLNITSGGNFLFQVNLTSNITGGPPLNVDEGLRCLETLARLALLVAEVGGGGHPGLEVIDYFDDPAEGCTSGQFGTPSRVLQLTGGTSVDITLSLNVNTFGVARQREPMVTSNVDAGNSGVLVITPMSEGAAYSSDSGIVYDGALEAACGDPNADGSTTASDALIVLQTGVGSQSCSLCVCDVNDSGQITATDALLVLQFAVGQPVALACIAC